jgi:transposase, IS30 family
LGGDLIKGADDRSSVGALIERTSGFVALAEMSSLSAIDVLESLAKPPGLHFSDVFFILSET